MSAAAAALNWRRNSTPSARATRTRQTNRHLRKSLEDLKSVHIERPGASELKTENVNLRAKTRAKTLELARLKRTFSARVKHATLCEDNRLR